MTERVRVMLLLSSLHGGGAERVAVHLVNRCDPALLDVRMGLLRKAGPFLADADPTRIDAASIGQDLLAFEGHNSSFYRPDKLLAGAALAPLNIRRMIQAHRSHVAMSFLKGMSLLTWLAIKSMGREAPRWIAREGNNTDAVIDDELANPAARAFVKGLTRRCYRSADCFLANSHEMANGLRGALTLDPARMRVIQNPIDVSMVRRRANEPLPQAPTRPYLVTAGRLEYQKGHDILLKAFAASDAARDMDLVILGRGTLEHSLRRQAAELGVADRVLFPGFMENPWSWIARADLFVLPSRWEGFPSIVAETLACAAPALVTACDFGPREVVEHGRSGWVVPPDDVGAFGAAMDMLLRRPDLTHQFRRNGPPRAARFDIDEMVEAYTELFIEQAHGGTAPAGRRPGRLRAGLRAGAATSGA
jgi:glycosyltransferase involved in cell wall biosynthesis